MRIIKDAKKICNLLRQVKPLATLGYLDLTNQMLGALGRYILVKLEVTKFLLDLVRKNLN